MLSMFQESENIFVIILKFLFIGSSNNCRKAFFLQEILNNIETSTKKA